MPEVIFQQLYREDPSFEIHVLFVDLLKTFFLTSRMMQFRKDW